MAGSGTLGLDKHPPKLERQIITRLSVEHHLSHFYFRDPISSCCCMVVKYSTYDLKVVEVSMRFQLI